MLGRELHDEDFDRHNPFLDDADDRMLPFTRPQQLLMAGSTDEGGSKNTRGFL